MNKGPERIFSDEDEAEMRAFYASCGISRDTTEAAINRRRNNKPVAQDNQKAREARAALKADCPGKKAPKRSNVET